MDSAAPAGKRRKTEVVVLVSGLPGALATVAAKACLRRGLHLLPVGLTGPRGTPSCVVEEGESKVDVRLVGSSDSAAQRSLLEDSRAKHGDNLVVVDASHPNAVNPNAELFSSVGCAFVMGTTGGDREALVKNMSSAGAYAVIAANMCKQIVALQATMQKMAADYPGSFSRYSFDIVESHQKTKVDTSGTAKDMIVSFSGLTGVDYAEKDIRKLRSEDKQLAFGVPADSLKGHAYHTYTLKSDDGSVEFQFKHNVRGRATYGDGMIDGCLFLAARRKEKSEKTVFDMIDVLKAGAMA